MEFCSRYGYNYGYNGSDEEDDTLLDDHLRNEETETKRKIFNKVRKVDSNMISVKFDKLVVANETFAGEPFKCKTCQAYVSSLSLPNIKQENNRFMWTCEFCETYNNLSEQMMKSLDEIPKKDDVTYLIEPAQAREEDLREEGTTSEKVKSTDDKYLTYCIDISGSMATKIPVHVDQNNNENVDRHMSRLKGVKIACMENLTYLKDNEPNKKVSLVTFSDSVRFYGDGTKSTIRNPLVDTSNQSNSGSFVSQTYQPQQQQQNIFSRMFRLNRHGNSSISNSNSNINTQEISRDILTNQEKMLALGQNQSADLKGVSNSFNGLKNIIQDLRTEGSTALGPALVFSIGYLTGKDGSQVILCTDGAANVGMGSMGSYGDHNDSYEFYDKLADYAKSKSITVNIITMEGTDCKLALLSRVADKTNGVMNIVNPAKLSDQFKSILDNRIVATSVKATLIVNHKYLYIRDIELEEEETKIEDDRKAHLDRLDQLKKSKLVKDIGNANLDTEITFEYGIRRQKEATNVRDFDEMPFQLQIEYICDGAKFTRVYTKKQKFTREKSKAVNNILDQNIFWASNVQKMSEHALNGNVFCSRKIAQALDSFVEEDKIIKMEIPGFLNESIKMYQSVFKSQPIGALKSVGSFGGRGGSSGSRGGSSGARGGINLSGSSVARHYSDEQSALFLSGKKANRKLFS